MDNLYRNNIFNPRHHYPEDDVEADRDADFAFFFLSTLHNVNYQCANYEVCNNRGKNVFKCETCRDQWCDECWGKRPKHKPQPTSTESIKIHEKTNLILETAIHNCFNPASNSETSIAAEWQRKEVARSFWFGIQRRQDDYFFEEGTIYEQLLQISKSSSAESPGIYPGLVSFVGSTGAGKSTLISLLIDLPQFEWPQLERKPTIRPNENDWTPTSADNHLYMDPTSRGDELPLLYVDCEGIGGGQQKPLTASWQDSTEARDSRDWRRRGRRIGWSEGSLEALNDRAFKVEKFYPRILYNFSDVVVYVLDQSNTG